MNSCSKKNILYHFMKVCGIFFGCWILWIILLLSAGASFDEASMIIPHDGWVPYSWSGVSRYLSIIDSTNGGIEMPIVPPIHFFNVLAWIILREVRNFCQSCNPAHIQILIMSLSITLCSFAAFCGFERLGKVFFSNSSNCQLYGWWTNWTVILVTTIFYIVSPPVLVYMSYGVIWTISIGLSVGLLPLVLGLFLSLLKAPLAANTIDQQLLFGGLVGIVGLGILLLFPLIIVLIVFALVFFREFKLRWRKFILPALVSLLIASPTLYAMYLATHPGTNFVTDLVAKNAAYGNIKGGLLTPLLERSAWPLYNIWEPRLVLNFYEHFYSFPFTTLILGVLLLICYLAIRRRDDYTIGTLSFIVVALFLIKGANPPFSEVFPALLNGIPLFSLIRTPDTKLSIIIHLGYAIVLLLALLSEYKNIRMFAFLVAIAFPMYNAIPILSGEALFGSNSGGGYKIELSKNEQRLGELLSAEPPWTRVLLLPPGVGKDMIRDTGLFSHEEPLKLITTSTFIQTGLEELSSPDMVVGMDRISKGDFGSLVDMGVNYVVVRNDYLSINSSKPYSALVNYLASISEWKMEFGELTLYRVSAPMPIPIVSTSGPVTGYSNSHGEISLYHFSLEKNNHNPVKVSLMGAYNSNWRLVSMDESCAGIYCYLDASFRILTSDSRVAFPLIGSDHSRTVWDLPESFIAQSKSFVVVFLPAVAMLSLLIVSTICLVVSFLFYLFFNGTQKKAWQYEE